MTMVAFLRLSRPSCDFRAARTSADSFGLAGAVFAAGASSGALLADERGVSSAATMEAARRSAGASRANEPEAIITSSDDNRRAPAGRSPACHPERERGIWAVGTGVTGQSHAVRRLRFV